MALYLQLHSGDPGVSGLKHVIDAPRKPWSKVGIFKAPRLFTIKFKWWQRRIRITHLSIWDARTDGWCIFSPIEMDEPVVVPRKHPWAEVTHINLTLTKM